MQYIFVKIDAKQETVSNSSINTPHNNSTPACDTKTVKTQRIERNCVICDRQIPSRIKKKTMKCSAEMCAVFSVSFRPGKVCNRCKYKYQLIMKSTDKNTTGKI